MSEKHINENILLVSYKCGIIDDNLAISLREKGFNIKYIHIDEKRFSRKGILKKISLIHNLYSKYFSNIDKLIICSGINDFLYLSLLLLGITERPRKLVIVLPPSPSRESGKLSGLRTLLVNTLLRLFDEVLIVYTTPKERMLTCGFLDEYEYTYLPISSNKPQLMRSLIHSDKPLFITTYRPEDKRFYIEILKLLRQLEVFPRFMFLVSEPITKCLNDPRVLCIHTDSYESIIDNASVVIIRENDPQGNELLIKSIMHGRPVLSSSEIGLLKLFIDTDLIVVENNWNPDNISLVLLKILNEIDRFKKASLSKIPMIINNDKGIEKIARFLK